MLLHSPRLLEPEFLRLPSIKAARRFRLSASQIARAEVESVREAR